MNPEQMQDILDIAENVRSPWPDILYGLMWVGLCLVFGIVMTFLILYLKKRAQNKGREKMPPDVFAKFQLTNLKKNLKVPLDILYLKLTEILKRYITDQFEVPVSDKTVPEMILLDEELYLKVCKKNEWKKIIELLKRSETIKFAKGSVAFEEFVQDADLVLSFVQSTSEEFKKKADQKA